MKFSWQGIYRISNGINLLRLLLVIPLWFLLDNYELQSVRYITFALCLFAAATDILDGILSRKLNLITEFGKIIETVKKNIKLEKEQIEVDSLEYLTIDEMLEAVSEAGKDNFCTACFSGNYPTKINTNFKKEMYEV